MASMTRVVETRYSPIFKKVELNCRVYDEQYDSVVESRMYFDYKELKEVINKLQDSLVEMADREWTEKHLMENNG